jgi:hypothetical protein
MTKVNKITQSARRKLLFSSPWMSLREKRIRRTKTECETLIEIYIGLLAGLKTSLFQREHHQDSSMHNQMIVSMGL